MLIVFFFTVILLLAFVVTLIISVRSPDHRIWPPRAPKTRYYILVWWIMLLMFGGIILLGIMDWNSLDWSPWIRYPAGLSAILVGNGLAWRGAAELGMKTTSGATSTKLRTTGLYAYSPNPQYIGDMLIFFGWVILTASSWVIIPAIIGIIVCILAVRVEETWLEEIHGEAYRSYCETTPRFVLV